MDIEVYKYGGAAILFVVCVIFMILPIWIKGFSWMSRMDALAGGVFLGAALVHLYPEGIHLLESFHFPLYAYMTLTGFFLMFVMESFTGSHGHNHKHEHSHELESSLNHESALNSQLISHENEEEDNSHFGSSQNKLPPTSIMLYCALMFHSVIESISYGVARDKQVLLSLFFALIGHKPVEIFALSVTLLESKPSKLKYFLLMGIYAIAVPITIVSFDFIGKSTGEIFPGIVTALSAGVFIFIGFHEIVEIMHEMPTLLVKEKVWLQLFVFIGFLWMSLMGLVGEHDHEHE